MISHDIHPDLGSLLADHAPNYAHTARGILAGAAFGIAGVTVLLVGLKVIPLPVREGLWQTVAAVAMGIIFLASGLFFVVDAVRSTGPRVLVYDRGFIAGREVFLWDQVEAVYLLDAEFSLSGIPLSLSEYIVRRDDGRAVRFTRGVHRAGDLAALMQGRVKPRLLAAARAALAAGQGVSFGDASIDSDGLTFFDLMSGRERKVGWSELQGIDSDGMQIRVFRVGESRLARWARAGGTIAVRKVANVAVFMAVTTEILADRGSGPDLE